MAEAMPSIDAWLKEAKQDPEFARCGMYLVHNGVVRATPRCLARDEASCDERGGVDANQTVSSMLFDYDQQSVDAAVASTRALPGIFYVRVWLNRGELAVGDDIMLVLVAGDIRPRVIDALQSLVSTLKNTCVREIERA